MTYVEMVWQMRKEFPGFSVRWKRDSFWMCMLGRVLFFNPAFMVLYATTIGNVVWVPDSWGSWSDTQKLVLLRHERIHMRQRRRLGSVLYTLMYLCWPLPAFLSWGRARLEWEAYSEGLKALSELKGTAALHDPRLKERHVAYFTTSAYAWMWPFPRQVSKWYDDLVKMLEAE